MQGSRISMHIDGNNNIQIGGDVTLLVSSSFSEKTLKKLIRKELGDILNKKATDLFCTKQKQSLCECELLNILHSYQFKKKSTPAHVVH